MPFVTCWMSHLISSNNTKYCPQCTNPTNVCTGCTHFYVQIINNNNKCLEKGLFQAINIIGCLSPTHYSSAVSNHFLNGEV